MLKGFKKEVFTFKIPAGLTPSVSWAWDLVYHKPSCDVTPCSSATNICCRQENLVAENRLKMLSDLDDSFGSDSFESSVDFEEIEEEVVVLQFRFSRNLIKTNRLQAMANVMKKVK